jgi:hypothetical protein
MWRLDRVGQDPSVSNFDVVRRFVVHPKEEFFMRFKKRAVLLTALAVTAVSAATVSQPATARPQYPIGSATIQSIDGYTLFTKLTATNATCDNTTTKAWSVDWSFAGTAQSPEFETKIVNVTPAIGGELAANNEKKQLADYPNPEAYRENRFTKRVSYVGTADQTLTVDFENIVVSAAKGPKTGEDFKAILAAKSPCAETTLPTDLAGASVFTPVPPARILDTRSGSGGKFADQDNRKVRIIGAGGVPAGASAVVLNVTATEASRAGFLTVWPGGGVPSISSVNVVEGQTVPNLVTVQIGSDGFVSVFSAGGTHVLLDVMGYYSPVTELARGGRYQAVPLQRAADTRNTGNAPGAGQSLNVPIAGKYSVPTGATAAVLNVTVTGVARGGFTTVYPGGAGRPNTSNLNSAGEDRANQAIVKLGADGSVDVYSENGSQIIVDVAGYFTNDSAALSRSGLFIPIAPLRVLSTRDGLNYDNVDGSGKPVKPGANSTTYARVGEQRGIDTGYAGSVVTNVTAVDATNAGFVTVYLNGSGRPITSTLNPAKGETVPNHATTALGTSGDIAIHTTAGAHFIVDAFGWYTA